MEDEEETGNLIDIQDSIEEAEQVHGEHKLNLNTGETENWLRAFCMYVPRKGTAGLRGYFFRGRTAGIENSKCLRERTAGLEYSVCLREEQLV